MEVKINRDIRNYQESMFFGLSIRQFIFSIFSCMSSLAVYFILRNRLNGELMYWPMMISALPGAFLGFFTYNGLSAEKFIVCYIKTLMTEKRILQPGNTNFYYSTIFMKEGRMTKCSRRSGKPSEKRGKASGFRRRSRM